MRRCRRALVGAVISTLLGGLPGSIVAQSDSELLTPPSELSGRFTCTSFWQDGTKTNTVLGPMGDGNLVRRETRGFVGRYTVDQMSDSRLDGTYSHYRDSDEYIGPAPLTPDHLWLVSNLLHIENEAGTWLGPAVDFYLPGTWDSAAEPRWERSVLAGEGAYEGLTALLETRVIDPDCYCWSLGTGQPEWCSWDIRGLVVEGEMPPVPSAE